MKFSKLSQLFLVSMIGLVVATLFTACNLVTIDYVFLATSAATDKCSGGQIETYAVDSSQARYALPRLQFVPAASLPWPLPFLPDTKTFM